MPALLGLFAHSNFADSCVAHHRRADNRGVPALSTSDDQAFEEPVQRRGSLQAPDLREHAIAPLRAECSCGHAPELRLDLRVRQRIPVVPLRMAGSPPSGAARPWSSLRSACTILADIGA